MHVACDVTSKKYDRNFDIRFRFRVMTDFSSFQQKPYKHVQCLPIKFFSGCAAYIDDPLPNIPEMANIDAYCCYMAILCMHLHFAMLFGPFFHMYMCTSCQQPSIEVQHLAVS